MRPSGEDLKKFYGEDIDPETIKDAERFRWLINRGVAWRGCYDGVWQEGEWLYAMQNAREEVDRAMGKDNPSQNTTAVKIGDTLSFMFKGRMIPFQIMGISGNSLYLRSCDLKWVNRCHVDFWLKQKKIIENASLHSPEWSAAERRSK